LCEAKKTAFNVLENISEAFEESTGQSFADCLNQNPKTRLQIRPTKQEQKKKRREQVRSYKSSIEQQYKESAVSAVLGTRTSKSQFNKIRMIESFQVQPQSSTASTIKSHTPAFDNIELRYHDEETLIAEVQSLPSDTINWSELARKYDVRVINSDNDVKNGGQVIKEFLRNKGIDVDCFGATQSVRVHRKRKMGPGGEISIPATSTIAEINSEIQKRIEDGTYNIGELITPKRFSRMILKDDGTFSTESFFIEGRKLPLLGIRQRTLHTHESLKLLRAKDVDYDSLSLETIDTVT
jgi:hypothetical protein